MLNFTIKLDKVRKEYPNIQFELKPKGFIRLSSHSFAFWKLRWPEVFRTIEADNEDIRIARCEVISINKQGWVAYIFLEIVAFFEEETPQEYSDSCQTK
jgi:hypothetical protein